jgi:trehalose-phosphatase
MQHLFSEWHEISERLRDRPISIFLDYDGTLAPIKRNPHKAVISKETKKLLSKLSKQASCKLAIISGRTLKDVKRFVGLKDIAYVGNHGLEMDNIDTKFREPISSKTQAIFDKIKDYFARKLSAIKGTRIEDKGLGISVHYRQVSPSGVRLLKNIFNEVTQSFIENEQIRVNRGKKVLEVRPQAGWNKGEIVLWLLAQQQADLNGGIAIPVYVGDDVTDEDAFRMLRNKGITVFVGKSKRSNALYYLRNIKEVKDFLKRLLKLCPQKAAAHG